MSAGEGQAPGRNKPTNPEPREGEGPGESTRTGINSAPLYCRTYVLVYELYDKAVGKQLELEMNSARLYFGTYVLLY